MRTDASGLLRRLDPQEERLVARLRAAGGDAVTFEQLRAEGFENPGRLCYDLEIAGVRIEHVDRRAPNGTLRRTAVRLEPRGEPQEPAALPALPIPAARPLAVAGLVAAMLLAMTLLLTDRGSRTDPSAAVDLREAPAQLQLRSSD